MTSVAVPQDSWAEVGDLTMRYQDWGGDGPPVMALHGLASSAHWYDLVAPYLRDQFRIVAPDQRGHGKTTQASSGYDWGTLAGDITRLMDHLGIAKASVFGHSWGGHVASNLAVRHPDRVQGVVLIDGGFQDGRMRAGATWESFRDRVRPRDVSGNKEQFLDRLRVQLADCWSNQLEGIVLSMVYEDDEGQIQDILRPENHAQVTRQMWDEPASKVLPQIRRPTLIVPAEPRPERANTEFAIMRREQVEMASRVIPSAQVRWISDTSHDIGYHQPRELASVITEFLDSLEV
jgi:pimeloyl-ACP methyl ester carboxylesterase